MTLRFKFWVCNANKEQYTLQSFRNLTPRQITIKFEATVPKPDLFRPKIRGGVSSLVLNINS